MKLIPRHSRVRRIVVALVCMASAVALPAADIHELKVAAFERKGVSLGFGREFPGASGRMSYTNGIATLNFDFTNGGHYIVMSAGCVARGAKKLMGRFRCTCSGADRVLVGVRGMDAKGDCYKSVRALKPDAEWRDMSFDLERLSWYRGKSTNATERGMVKWPIGNLEIICEPLPVEKFAGTLDIEGLRLATEAESVDQADWTFSLRAPRGVEALFYPGETLSIPYELIPLRVDGGGMSARLVCASVADGEGNAVCDRRLADTVGALVLDEEMVGGRFGAFRVAFIGVDAKGVERKFGSTWCARLAGRSRPVSWCGTGVHGWKQAGRYPMIAAAGIGMVRSDIVWSQWERERGVYSCSNGFKDALDEMHSLGIQLNGIFNGAHNPLYGEAVKGKDGKSRRTLDRDAFCNWVRYFVANEGKDVDFYEVWNEAWNNYFGPMYSWPQTTGGKHGDKVWLREFVSFSRMVADTVRSVRPDAHIGVGAEDGSGGSLVWMLEEGIAQKEDCVTFHPYIHLNDPRPERFGFFFADDGARIRQAQAANGGSTRLRITEMGWTTYSVDEHGKSEHWFVGGYPGVTYCSQANYLIRAFLLARSFGIESAMQYDFSDDGPRRNYTEHNFGLVFQNLTPKPSYAAVAFMTHLLGEATPLGRNFGSDKKTHRIVGFDLPDGRRFYAAWAVETPVDVSLPRDMEGKPVTVLDIYGNTVHPSASDRLTLTERPVYITHSTRAERK